MNHVLLNIKKTVLLLLCLCQLIFSSDKNSSMKITKEPFGKIESTAVDLYTLVNNKGMKVKITNYGGIITSISVPDKNGEIGEVVLGFDNLNDYLTKSPYYGCLIGRFGNRIAGGKFKLDNKTYDLAKNNGPNHLHGGRKGFDKVIWNAHEMKNNESVGLKLSYLSKDGEEGYPGNLSVIVTYTLTNVNEIKINYTATTDKKTICNLTNHSYFNLKDGGKSAILDHELLIKAEKFTPVDKTLIPTGDLVSVQGTPLDFRKYYKIGERINTDHEQINFGTGYDHNYAIDGESGKLRLAAQVLESTSGRIMEVYSDQPGIQFYSGSYRGKKKASPRHRHGFCLETQHYPDSPNQPHFPSTVLEPGDVYNTTTIYKFLLRK